MRTCRLDFTKCFLFYSLTLSFKFQFKLDPLGVNILATHSWDIYFEFKTTTRNAVILHARGPSDFIKVEIINGNLIKFQVEAGSGPLGVNVLTTGSLSDNEWHSVQLEKNR